MNNDIERILYIQGDLDSHTGRMAVELSVRHKDEESTVIPVLNGVMIFASDMIKRLNLKLIIGSIKASSYAGMQSTGEVKITQDIKSDVKDRPVIFMEDIIDTDRALQALSEVMKGRGVKSVEVVAMPDKPETHIVDFHAGYYGFKTSDEFLVSYDSNYNGLYRSPPYVGTLRHEVYVN